MMLEVSLRCREAAVLFYKFNIAAPRKVTPFTKTKNQSAESSILQTKTSNPLFKLKTMLAADCSVMLRTTTESTLGNSSLTSQ